MSWPFFFVLFYILNTQMLDHVLLNYNYFKLNKHKMNHLKLDLKFELHDFLLSFT